MIEHDFLDDLNEVTIYSGEDYIPDFLCDVFKDVVEEGLLEREKISMENFKEIEKSLVFQNEKERKMQLKRLCYLLEQYFLPHISVFGKTY